MYAMHMTGACSRLISSGIDPDIWLTDDADGFNLPSVSSRRLEKMLGANTINAQFPSDAIIQM